MTEITEPVEITEPALPNPHAGNGDVHYRLYLGYDWDGNPEPTTICVQSFDYYDYVAEKFLTTDSYESREEAETALEAHIDRLFGRNTTGYVTRDDAVRAAVLAKEARG